MSDYADQSQRLALVQMQRDAEQKREAEIRADERRRVLDELEAVARAVNYAHVRADLTAIIEAMRGTE